MKLALSESGPKRVSAGENVGGLYLALSCLCACICYTFFADVSGKMTGRSLVTLDSIYPSYEDGTTANS